MRDELRRTQLKCDRVEGAQLRAYSVHIRSANREVRLCEIRLPLAQLSEQAPSTSEIVGSIFVADSDACVERAKVPPILYPEYARSQLVGCHTQPPFRLNQVELRPSQFSLAFSCKYILIHIWMISTLTYLLVLINEDKNR